MTGLSAAKKRALALADNKIAENAGWDREILAAELPELGELLLEEQLDISLTGFAVAEIDQILFDVDAVGEDAVDTIDEDFFDKDLITQNDDL